MKKTTITEIMNGPWLQRAIYTAEERGIPQFADGLKPVQRFLICHALQKQKGKFEKVSSLATISSLGYLHGEASAATALTSMAADYSNNLPLFEGDGNFGNVLNPSAGAPRYIYARLSPLFDLIFKDMDLCPKHEDPDHIPPKYYLPVIPIVLVNGSKGIATGYATDIPPHDPLSIIDWLIERNKKEQPKTEIKPKCYGFEGTITKFDDHYEIAGNYELVGANKIRVTELPRSYTCLSYDNYLRKLEDKGTIVSFENNSRMNRFDYLITLKRGTKWTDAEIHKNLKLNTIHTWNLTTVAIGGKIQEWSKTTGIIDMMEAFYQFRLPYIEKRIQNKIVYFDELLKCQLALQNFCMDVIQKRFKFDRLTEDDFHDRLISEYHTPESYVDKIINMPVRNFTSNMIFRLEKNISETKQELDYYRSTNPNKEYIKDLTELRKAIIKYMKQVE